MFTNKQLFLSISIYIVFMFVFLNPAHGQQGVFLPPAPRTLITHQDEAGGFSIGYPEGWAIDQQEAGPLRYVILTAPLDGADDVFAENIVIVTENLTAPFSLDSYFEQSLANLAQQLAGFQSRPPFDFTLSGIPTTGVAFSGEYGGRQLSWILLVTGRNGRAYSLLLNALPEELDAFWQSAADILSSFTVRGEVGGETFTPLLPLADKEPVQKDGDRIEAAEKAQDEIIELIEEIPGPTEEVPQDEGEERETAELPLPEGFIAFASEKAKGSFQIARIKADGSQYQLLTNEPIMAWQPSFSPDGKKIAYVSYLDFNQEIMVMNSDGSSSIRLTGDQEDQEKPCWSNDGTHIFFSSQPGIFASADQGIFTSAPPRYADIYTIDIVSLQRETLTQFSANDIDPACSPDGSSIAFASDREGNYEIYLMNPDGTDIRRLTKNISEDLSPAWSPDGQNLAFATKRDGNWEIYIMDRDGENPVNLTKHGAADHSPSWSPDGNWIAFVSNRDGNDEIYIMQKNGTNIHRLTHNPHDDWHPTWAPLP